MKMIIERQPLPHLFRFCECLHILSSIPSSIVLVLP